MRVIPCGLRRLAPIAALSVLPLACHEPVPGGGEVTLNQGALTAAFSISGRVLRPDGTALSGVTLTLAGSSQAAQATDAAGRYNFGGLSVGSFSVRPSKDGCSFSPDVVNLNDLAASRTQDFVGSGTACQGSIGPSAIAWTDAAANLIATRDYATGTWKDAESTFPDPIRISVPATLPVSMGNAGTGSATLSYWVSWGEVRCEYRGGSSVSNPTTPIQIAEGQEYKLQSCWDGAQGGDERLVSRVKLHIQEGNGADPAHLTEVRVRLGGTPILDPPLSRAESVALREAFTWENTKALPETNSEGKPSLWYALIYVETKEDREALNWLYIHHNTLPMFGSELARWNGRRGVLTNPGDGVGSWVFAVVPGITYNQIRQAALGGDEIFRAISLRQPPAEVRNPDGSLSHAALMANAFAYEADLSTVVPDDGATLAKLSTATAASTTKAHRRIGLRRIIRGIATVVKGTVELVVRGLGAVDRWVNGDLKLTLALEVLNTDSTFGTATPFVRSWGARRGETAKLPGVRVQVLQIVPGGIPTAFTGRTGSDGAVSIKVGRYRDSFVCMEMGNDAANVTEWLFPKQLCDFSYKANQLSGDFTANWNLRNQDVNILMQATEGRAYLMDVAGHTPVRAEIMVGPAADLIGKINNDLAFTPCLGFRNAQFDQMVSAVDMLLLEIFPVAWPAFEAAKGVYGSIDIMFPANGTGGSEAKDSRGVPTHEYGHFALCSLMDSLGPNVLSDAYTDSMLAPLLGSTGPASYLNEAFADFFASQVAGCTNYFYPTNSTLKLQMKYCPYNNACLDENTNSNSDYYDTIKRIVTTLHDAFDGQPTTGNVPGNVDVWDTSTIPWTATTPAAGTGNLRDEDVALPGSQIRGFLQRWSERSSTLSEASVLGGLADAMTDAGYSWCDRCKVFALHHASLMGPVPPSDRQMYDVCQTAPISDWLGTAPDKTDPNACLFATYFVGCRGGAYMCDELVDPVYFQNHLGCTASPSCLGRYYACPAACPAPTAEEAANVVAKAAGTPADDAKLSIGYYWTASTPVGTTGGFRNVEVAGQPWSELQFGVGGHASSGNAKVRCETHQAGHLVANISVLWKSGTTLTIDCGVGTCEADVPVSDGFTATCNFGP